MNRGRRTSHVFQLERRVGRALAAVLLAVVGYQSMLVAQNLCTKSGGSATPALAASTNAHDMASMEHPAQPADAPTHRTNCDHDRMISACASCAVVVASAITIAPAAGQAAWVPAGIAEFPNSFDALPLVPPPRV